MKLSWVTPFLVRLLSLTRFASATGGESSALTLGIRLNLPAVSSEPLDSQPLLSLDPNLFVQYGSNELRIPIMPLHLLGKKSWNVYNHDNIEKVKRDEAAARAKEEAEEQRMQEIDAQRRIQILRGEEPTPLPEIEEAPDDGGRKRRLDDGSGRERKRLRRGYGENETDWEMRLAQEQSQASNTDRQVVLRKPTTADAPLVDHSGHIDLFPQERKKVSVEKNADAEREKKKKERELEDQYTMRFSNAAGFKQGLDNPWYSKVTAGIETDDEPVSKDVWGNEDPRRKQRQAARIVASDPLAAMRQGAAKVRQVERERKRWREEKEKETEQLEAEERRKRRKRRYEGYEEEDDLEDFSLDRSEMSSPRHRDGDRERERRHRHKESRRSSHRDESHRHRHRDEDRRHRHRHRSRD